MKIRFNREQLLNAINIASKAVSSKTTMPILECFLITAFGSEVRITANDAELGIETVIHTSEDEGKRGACSIMEPGRTALEARLFSDIIRKITAESDSDIVLEQNGSVVIITCNSSEYRIQERDPDQFPALPFIHEDRYIALSQFTLREVIRQTLFSVAANDSNKMMTGELFEVKNTILKAVSLDGHRISIRNTELRDDYGTLQAIIPGKTLNEISKILDGEAESEVQIFFDENHVMFRFDDTTVVSRLIDGEYFRIDSMLSSDYDTKVTVNKRAFLDNIERSIVLLRETDRKPLVLTITDGCMNLKMNTVVGRLNSDLDIHKIGKDIMIGLNPKFLLDTLRVIDDEDVCLYMTNAKAPCFIRDDENKYIYLILPINFNPAAYDV